MKHLKIVVLALAFGITPLLAWVGLAHAQTFSATTDEHRTVNSTLYSAGHNVSVRGTINGDVFCAGQSVTVDATVHGDVICAGQDVTINGHVDGSVRVAGQTVHVGAQMTRSLTAAGQTFTLDDKASVGQDATINGSTTEVKGAIMRDMVLNSSDATVRNVVGRNVRFNGSTLRLAQGAVVGGDLNYTSNNGADVASGAQVKGATHHSVPQKHERNNRAQGMFAFGFGFYLIMLAICVITALVLVLVFPRAFHATSGMAARSMGKTLLTGFLAGLVVPMAFFVLLFSLVGIPLALVLLFAWLVILMLSGPVAAYWLGSVILAKSKNPILMMLLGTFILVTLYFIPVVGLVVMIVASWLGTGAILLKLQQHIPAPKYHLE